jgi:hypothetical protein
MYALQGEQRDDIVLDDKEVLAGLLEKAAAIDNEETPEVVEPTKKN